jgi:hypothetical protein
MEPAQPDPADDRPAFDDRPASTDHPPADGRPVAEEADRPPTWRQRLWQRAQPGLRQAWLNARVWMPFLINPFERKRMIRYTSREDRVGLSWKIGLPPQCWSCGQEDGLRRKRYSADVRAYEFPIGVAAGTFLALVLIAISSLCLPGWATVTLMSLALLAGIVIFWLKSWPEQVSVTIWSCPEHQADVTRPEMAVYDEELFLFLPSVELTKAALAQQKERRKRGSSEETSDEAGRS